MNAKTQTPRKGHTVRDLGGSLGTIKSVSRGFAYVNFGTGTYAPIAITNLRLDNGRNWVEVGK